MTRCTKKAIVQEHHPRKFTSFQLEKVFQLSEMVLLPAPASKRLPQVPIYVAMMQRNPNPSNSIATHPTSLSIANMTLQPKCVGIKVVARFRPVDDEKVHLENDDQLNFRIFEARSIALTSPTGTEYMFHLDSILDDHTTQQQIFEAVGDPIIRDVLMGYNGTIFAFGQTGSGKTHTLFGDMSHPDAVERGIIPQSCRQIFEHFKCAQDIEEVTIKCSFIEIYSEKLQDLLLSQNTGNLKIRQRIDETVFVENLHEEFVSSFTDIYDLLQIGFRNRMVASTKMKSQSSHRSSRSHCVLTLNIKQTLKGGTVKKSKINFADLAGSENVKKTKASGKLLKEAKSINKSLSALGNVIAALTSKKRGGTRVHVPFRESKLTHLLKDALAGNTKTTLIAACSSEVHHVEETISTLRFATRAKKVMNKVSVNERKSIRELHLINKVLEESMKSEKRLNHKMMAFLEMLQEKYSEHEVSDEIKNFLLTLDAKLANDSITSESTPKSLENDETEQQSAMNTIYHLGEQIKRMREELDAKDRAVADLNEHIVSLKQNAAARLCREKWMNLQNFVQQKPSGSNVNQSEINALMGLLKRMSDYWQEKENAMTELIDKKNEEENGVVDNAQKGLPCSALAYTKVAADGDKQSQLIESLKLTNEQLMGDLARLSQRNEELQFENTRRSTVISPVLVGRNSGLLLVASQHDLKARRTYGPDGLIDTISGNSDGNEQPDLEQKQPR